MGTETRKSTGTTCSSKMQKKLLRRYCAYGHEIWMAIGLTKANKKKMKENEWYT
jgi:hypothetical protein